MLKKYVEMFTENVGILMLPVLIVFTLSWPQNGEVQAAAIGGVNSINEAEALDHLREQHHNDILRGLETVSGNGNSLRAFNQFQPQFRNVQLARLATANKPYLRRYNGWRHYQQQLQQQQQPTKRLDSLLGMSLGQQKRNFDEIDRAGFSGFNKKNFDEIDRAGFSGFNKKNFDEIDRAGFAGFAKKNFDEIDRAGFNDFSKRDAKERK